MDDDSDDPQSAAGHPSAGQPASSAWALAMGSAALLVLTFGPAALALDPGRQSSWTPGADPAASATPVTSDETSTDPRDIDGEDS